MTNSLFALALTLALAGSCLAQEDPLAWIDARQVRAAYHYANAPAEERCARLKAAGMNAMILKAGVEKALPWCRQAKLQGMKCFLALNFNVDAEKAGLRQAVLESGQVERYACPLDQRFWREHLIPGMMERAAVSDDPAMQVDGLWIDFELYSTRTGQRYYTKACYCDHCLGEFCRHKGIEVPEVEYANRKQWLDDHGYGDEYQPFLGTRVEELATEVRETLHAQYPDFLLGFYPTPHNWSLLAVARAFSTERVPILLWATDTYGGGGMDRVPDDWRTLYADQGINARYLAGMLLRCYSAQNLAANIYHTTSKCDGYWLFTTYTLEAEEQKGDYHLAAGTPEDYWAALRLANDEMDRRIQEGPDYRTELVVGPEPVVYKPLSQPEFRERLARLILPEPLSERLDLPLVKLRGANVLVLAGRAGQEAKVWLAYHQVGPVQAEISWQIMDADRTMIASGNARPGAALAEGSVSPRETQGEGFALSFTPEADGIYYILASAQSSAWSVTGTNVPVGLYAGAKLHTIGGAERLYFAVPEGVEQFSLQPAGASGRETVRVDVYDPDGTQVATGQSTEEAFEVEIAVDADDRAGDMWSLAIAKADVGILEDTYLTLPEPLPPVLSLAPEHVFDIRAD